MRADPIYCGVCARYEGDVPPESRGCDHFSVHESDALWLAAAGAILTLDPGQRVDRKWYFRYPFPLASHYTFSPVDLERSSNGNTFKLPLVGGGRIHYVETGDGSRFATVHIDESDPDLRTPRNLIGHGLEFGGRFLSKTLESVRPGAGGGTGAPLYVTPGHESIALDFVRERGRIDAVHDQPISTF